MGSSSDHFTSLEEHQLEEPRQVVLVLEAPDPPTLLQELKECISLSPPNCSFPSLFGFLPLLQWARNYNMEMLRSDLMAGLTLASLGIPQSIGYASLAKLDPQYGLYTSIVPPLIYTVMGSSREIAIGPVAVVSLLLSSMIQKTVDPITDPAAYMRMVFTTTFFTGIFQSLFGFLRLGFLVDFLSHAAITGFMAGAAIVIGLQQLKGLFGMSHFTNNTDVVSVMKATWNAMHEPWHPGNILLGCSFLIFILGAKFMGRRNKKLFWLSAIAPLLSFVVSTLMVFITGANEHGVKTIQHVKGGLNPSSLNQLQFGSPHIEEAAKNGLLCAAIALAEGIAVGQTFASIRGYQLDGNKEMVAMGFMNIAGSLTSCYVATGSFSRTAVNFSAGCRTPVSNFVMAITVLITLELLTRLLYYTPVAILASIILSALPGLIDLKEAYKIWEVDKMDFVACLGAFFGALFGSVEIGLLTAVIISFGKIIIASIRPQIEKLGRIQGTDIFCSTRQYPMAVSTPRMLVTRINTCFLCFTNANFIRERILRWVVEQEDSGGVKSEERIESVVIDMSNVMNVDTSGIAAIEELYKKLISLQVKMAIANPSWHVIHKMKLAGLVEMIGGASIFLTVSEAVEACLDAKIDIANGC